MTKKDLELEKFNPQSMDAKVWAVEFIRIFDKRRDEIEEGLMIAWFASSIMAGYDEANRRAEKKHNQEEVKLLESLKSDKDRYQTPLHYRLQKEIDKLKGSE